MSTNSPYFKEIVPLLI